MSTQNPESGHNGRWIVVALVVVALALSTLILLVNRPALDGPPALPLGRNQTGVDAK